MNVVSNFNPYQNHLIFDFLLNQTLEHSIAVGTVALPLCQESTIFKKFFLGLKKNFLSTPNYKSCPAVTTLFI